MIKEEILAVLDEIKLSQTCWEDDEDIMTFNGKPIGCTIPRIRGNIDRWWPELKKEIASFLIDNLPIVEKKAKYIIPNHIRTGTLKYSSGLRYSGLISNAIGVVAINPKKDTQVIIHKELGW